MKWIHRYQLFLFDFDGLLVNTEELHYKAYIKMCANRNIDLKWDFLQYSGLAHHSATGVREKLYEEFPGLRSIDWSDLYDEKKRAFLQSLKEGTAELMPGVYLLLETLKQANINRCVVTHSALPLISTIREQNPILNTIPHWITREDYSNPKPDSECYRLAVNKLAKSTDKIIGFEDSPRGLHALKGTQALPVLICSPSYPYVCETNKSAHKYYPSFNAINDLDHP